MDFSFPSHEKLKSASQALNWENSSQPDMSRQRVSSVTASSRGSGAVSGGTLPLVGSRGTRGSATARIPSRSGEHNVRPRDMAANQESIDQLVKQLQQIHRAQVNQRQLPGGAGQGHQMERGVLRPAMGGPTSSRGVSQQVMLGMDGAAGRAGGAGGTLTALSGPAAPRRAMSQGPGDSGDADSLEPLKGRMYRQGAGGGLAIAGRNGRTAVVQQAGGLQPQQVQQGPRSAAGLSAHSNGFRPHGTGAGLSLPSGATRAGSDVDRRSPPPSPPVSPHHRTPSQTEKAKSSAAYLELRQKAELYNHAHMARFFNTQRMAVSSTRSSSRYSSSSSSGRDLTVQQVARHYSTAASDSGIRYDSDARSELSQDSEKGGPPLSAGDYGANGFQAIHSTSQWYRYHEHRRSSRHDQFRGGGSAGSMISRASRSASIPMSQRSPIIYETRVDATDDEPFMTGTPVGGDERAAFFKHSSSGEGLSESEFAAVLASYVDADESTATRAANFLFEQFTRGSMEAGVMDEQQFLRAVTFIKLKVWQNLSHNFEGYYELFRFLDRDEDELVDQKDFSTCFLLCAGFLRSLNRIPEKVDDDFRLSDQSMVTQFVGLIFRILDVDEDQFVEEKAFCYGFKAGMGLLLLGQQQSLRLHQNWTVEEWMAFFDVVDFNNSGEIVMDEFLFGFQILWGLNVSLAKDLDDVSEAYQKLEFQLIDRESRGSISANLFVQQMQQLYQVTKRRSLQDYLYRRCFRLLDLDASGHLTRSDICHFIHAFQRSWQAPDDAKTLDRYFKKKCEKYEYITEEKFLKYCTRTVPMWRSRRSWCGIF